MLHETSFKKSLGFSTGFVVSNSGVEWGNHCSGWKAWPFTIFTAYQAHAQRMAILYCFFHTFGKWVCRTKRKSCFNFNTIYIIESRHICTSSDGLKGIHYRTLFNPSNFITGLKSEIIYIQSVRQQSGWSSTKFDIVLNKLRGWQAPGTPKAICSLSHVLTEILSVVQGYMCFCTYHSLFSLGAFRFYHLVPGSTPAYSLLLNGSLLCRFAAPMAYNYLHIIRMAGMYNGKHWWCKLHGK